jgi:S1-C subfamily serine protease
MPSSVVHQQWSTFSAELAEAAEKAGNSVVCVHSRHRHAASGVVWQKGVVVTAGHALAGGEVSVIDVQGRTLPVELAGSDASTDLAVLKIPADANLSAAGVGDAKGLKIGHFVLALGRTRRGNLVSSSGVISGLMGPWRTWRGGEIDQFVRPDLVLYPGFSGGPLVDSGDKMLGLNTAGLRRGLPITIPSSTVSRVVQELVEKGRIARPYLGLAMQSVALPAELRNKLNLAGSSGALIMHVETDGPAGKAGILLGDILTGMRGQPIEDSDDIQIQLGKSRVGESLAVSLIRGGERLEVHLTLAERPAR